MESPRLEVEVPLPAPPARPWGAYVTAAMMAAVGVWMPQAYGLPIVLPAFLIWFGMRATQRGARMAYRVRIDDAHVEVETEHCVGRTPLAHVSRVVESAEGFTLALPASAVEIPMAALGGDRRRLLDALPAHVAHQTAPAAAKANGARVVWLWLLLVGLLAAVYYVAGAR
jgi:hypothetical protein